MNIPNHRLAEILVLNILIVGVCFMLSASINTQTGGKMAIYANQTSSTVVYANGTDVYSVRAQLVPYSSGFVFALYFIVVALILGIDALIIYQDTIFKGFNNRIRVFVTKPMSDAEIEARTKLFELELRVMSKKLEKDEKQEGGWPDPS